MADTLSAELLYPDCPCGADGALSTVRALDDGYDWFCLGCEESFNTPPGSAWDGVAGLREPYRKAYIAVEIRGLRPERHASTSGKTAETVERQVRLAKERLRSQDGAAARTA